MKIKYYYKIILLLISIATFYGCAKLDKDYPARDYYTLSVQRPPGNFGNEIDKIFEFTRMSISPNFNGREFIYKLDDSKFDSDFYNQFFSPPAVIITVEVGGWIESSKIFKNVVDPYTPIYPNYSLHGTIKELFGDYSKSKPEAVLSIHFYLLDESEIDSKIILNRAYSEKIEINSKSAKSLIEGWNNALARILSNLESDLKKLDL